MKSQKYCKIVQDLLPLYIDDLTNKETNQFIEKHIEGCDKCKQTLTDMQGEIKLEKISNSIEIKGLKKVKRRMRLHILVAIILTILLFFTGIYINNNYSIYKNEEGKLAIKSFNPKINVSNEKYLIIKAKIAREGTKDGNIYVEHIATINEENICTNMRYIEVGYTDEELKTLYESFVDNEELKVFTNVEMRDNRLYYNANMYNGKDKDTIINEFENYYDEIECIEEL